MISWIFILHALTRRQRNNSMGKFLVWFFWFCKFVALRVTESNALNNQHARDNNRKLRIQWNKRRQQLIITPIASHRRTLISRCSGINLDPLQIRELGRLLSRVQQNSAHYWRFWINILKVWRLDDDLSQFWKHLLDRNYVCFSANAFLHASCICFEHSWPLQARSENRQALNWMRWRDSVEKQ